LYVVESRFSLTGAMADHRLRCPASQIAAVVHALATKVLAGTRDSSLGSVMANFQPPPSGASGAATFEETWASGLQDVLIAKPGASLVLVGPSQPVAVHHLAYAINAALKTVGQ